MDAAPGQGLPGLLGRNRVLTCGRVRRSLAMARGLGLKNIHVVHLMINAGVDSAAIHARLKASGVDLATIKPDSLTKTSSIAEAYWFTHHQSRDGWTHELDLRPGAEVW